MSVVALVGVTASGKSEAALELARRRGDCEIVSVDSMCVYRGMDIGTSKPGPEARRAVPHHLLDLVDPDQDFTVTRFQLAARYSLEGIAARGHHALLVGGTGLYLRAVVDVLRIPGRYPEVAVGLEAELDEGRATPEDLHRRLARLDPVGAERMAPTNRRRVVRALEVTVGSGQPFSQFGPGLEAYPATGIAQVGLARPPDEVDRRIGARFDAMVDAGLVREVLRPGRSTGRAVADGTTGSGVSRGPGPRGEGGAAARLSGAGGPAHPAVRPPPAVLVRPRPAHRLGPQTAGGVQDLLERAIDTPARVEV